MLQDQKSYTVPESSEEIHVLIAPSWGPNGLLETMGETVVSELLNAGYKVTVRPHPRTNEHTPLVLSSLTKLFSSNKRFNQEQSIASFDSLLAADIMISDWSGAALEFAFGLEKPVLFIDLPAKVNNSEYEQIEATPLEVFLRDEVGSILRPEKIDTIAAAVDILINDRDKIVASIRSCRDSWIYNVGKSSKKGAEIIHQISLDVRDDKEVS